MIDIETLPKELTVKRHIIECNWICSLFLHPELFDDYKHIQNTEDIISLDGVFYYSLGLEMYKAGYRTFDDLAIKTFAGDKTTYLKGYEERGGYDFIKSVSQFITEENIDVYYEELIKNNLLIRLYLEGFDVLSKLDMFRTMSSEDIYDYFDSRLANISMGKVEKMQSYNLSDPSGYVEWFKQVDSGGMVGYKINTPMLNYACAGLHPDNLTLHISGIGRGKTTTAILLYVLGIIKQGDTNIAILSNEQGVNEFRNMIIPCVIFNELHLRIKGLNRQKFVTGHFNDEQTNAVREAIDWLAKQPGKIEFIPLVNYDIGSIRKVVKKYSRSGYGAFIVDTIKPIDETDNAWAQFSELSKSLFLLSKSTHSMILCTAQATGESLGRKYLDLSCIAKSKAIAETATQCIAFRDITSDEATKMKAWRYKRNPDGSTDMKIKVDIDLDPNETYILLFILKNRFGPTDPQIVMKFNRTFCTLEEVGYYNCPYDGRR